MSTVAKPASTLRVADEIIDGRQIRRPVLRLEVIPDKCVIARIDRGSCFVFEPDELVEVFDAEHEEVRAALARGLRLEHLRKHEIRGAIDWDWLPDHEQRMWLERADAEMGETSDPAIPQIEPAILTERHS